MVHLFVAPLELFWLSLLGLTSAHCHKSTGWEAVQLALPSALDGMGYLFHNDPLRPSALSLFIFVSLSLTRSDEHTSSPLSLHSSCILLQWKQLHDVYTHKMHRNTCELWHIRPNITTQNAASSLPGEQLHPTTSKVEKKHHNKQKVNMAASPTAIPPSARTHCVYVYVVVSGSCGFLVLTLGSITGPLKAGRSLASCLHRSFFILIYSRLFNSLVSVSVVDSRL